MAVPLPNGSMYAFGRDLNVEWKHGIPQVGGWGGGGVRGCCPETREASVSAVAGTHAVDDGLRFRPGKRPPPFVRSTAGARGPADGPGEDLDHRVGVDRPGARGALRRGILIRSDSCTRPNRVVCTTRHVTPPGSRQARARTTAIATAPPPRRVSIIAHHRSHRSHRPRRPPPARRCPSPGVRESECRGRKQTTPRRGRLLMSPPAHPAHRTSRTASRPTSPDIAHYRHTRVAESLEDEGGPGGTLRQILRLTPRRRSHGVS